MVMDAFWGGNAKSAEMTAFAKMHIGNEKGAKHRCERRSICIEVKFNTSECMGDGPRHYLKTLR
jgi:hypothetical protein